MTYGEKTENPKNKQRNISKVARQLQTALFRLISRNAAIYDPEKDIDDQEIGRVLDQHGDYEQRAGRLLGE